MKIDSLRRKVDAVDAEVISLLAKRKELVLLLINEKKKMGLPLRQVQREKEILAKALRTSSLDKKFIRRIFKDIFEYSYTLHRKKQK